MPSPRVAALSSSKNSPGCDAQGRRGATTHSHRTEREGVVGLARSRFPCGLLPCRFRSSDGLAVDRFVECEQPGLMRQKLANGDRVFALLREFRPIPAHGYLIIEPAA